jgi:subtilisin family serine protease/subtilisin-like proprotein convertase family protein
MFNKRQFKILISLIAGLILSLSFTNCGADSFKLNLASTGLNVAAGNSQLQGADPLFSLSWFFENTGQSVFAARGGTAGEDLNVIPVWEQNLFGQGVRIQVSDTGVDDLHEDLRINYSTQSDSKDYTLAAPYLSMTSRPRAAGDNHGTSVAGLIAAVHNNSLGSRGVASQATITNANFLSGAVAQSDAVYLDQLQGSFDISNMSWGIRQNTFGVRSQNWETILRNQVQTGRSGRGKIYVKAAGNDFLVACRGTTNVPCVGNAGFDPDANTPYTIIVGALDSTGLTASYSSPGSNTWVTSFGGAFATDSPAMITTDRSSCDVGYARTQSTSTIVFERGQNGNVGCNYTSTFNGTSSAAPMVSGTIALLLQLRPELTWRDIKYILARSARQPAFQTVTPINHPLSEPVPAGYAWEQPWVVNSAGIRFHNWFGFGRVDATAAVNFAQTYVSPFGAYQETNWLHEAAGLTLNIPDFTAQGAVSTLSVNQSLRAEAVQIRVWVTHADVSELALELTSPTGTKSILINGRNSLRGLPNYQGELFLSNAFYREQITGIWTLRVFDLKTGNPAGTLTRWMLNFAGSPQ